MPPTPPQPEKVKPQNVAYESYPPDRYFSEEYANNVYLEPSVWDLKLIFGLLDQREGKNLVRQHTAISLAWPQVKVFYHWLKGYIEFHEHLNGKIIVPALGVPPEVDPPTDEQKATNAHAEKAYEIFSKMRAELIESQKP